MNYPIPPTCLISVSGSSTPGTESSLHYAIPVDGVADPVTIFIHIILRNATPLGKVVLLQTVTIRYLTVVPLDVTAQSATGTLRKRGRGILSIL